MVNQQTLSGQVDKDIFGDDQDGTIAIYAQGFLKNKFPCGTPWSIPPIWTAACDSVSQDDTKSPKRGRACVIQSMETAAK